MIILKENTDKLQPSAYRHPDLPYYTCKHLEDLFLVRHFLADSWELAKQPVYYGESFVWSMNEQQEEELIKIAALHNVKIEFEEWFR